MQGVVVIKPFDGDLLFIAVSRVTMYSPSDNIHHNTVEGKDISLLVNQRFDTANLQGRVPVETMISNIKYEDIWEIPPHIEFYWYKMRESN